MEEAQASRLPDIWQEVRYSDVEASSRLKWTLIVYLLIVVGGGRSAVQLVQGTDVITAGGGGGGADCLRTRGCGGGGK